MVDMKNPSITINQLASALKTEMRRRLREFDSKYNGNGICAAAIRVRKYYLDK